ncbi:unannotated protein [freshwater metagenome]|uniref:Unannotated protein n=1 Tax=freshwater metagenome TaxID=449393 RepID=A0A6J6C5P4_9ZZZZ
MQAHASLLNRRRVERLHQTQQQLLGAAAIGPMLDRWWGADPHAATPPTATPPPMSRAHSRPQQQRTREFTPAWSAPRNEAVGKVPRDRCGNGTLWASSRWHQRKSAVSFVPRRDLAWLVTDPSTRSPSSSRSTSPPSCSLGRSSTRCTICSSRRST